jgi:hypothetical protein
MLVPDQMVGVAAVPLNATVLVPCVDPKFTPEIVTAVPAGPEVGEMLLIVGVCETVNGTPLLATLPTLTITFPDVALIGTGTVMLVALQLVGLATVLLNVTTLPACVAPKFVPAMITDAPGIATLGDKVVIEGAAI